MLKQRIITALLLVPLVLGALFFLPLKFFALLAALVFLLASREWSGFVSAQPQQWLPLVFCLLLGASLFWLPVDQLWTPHLHPLVMGVLWTAVSWWLLGLLLVGLWVVPAALVIAINMLVAFFLVHTKQVLMLQSSGGWALELQAFFFVTALVVAMGSSRD